MPAQNNNTHTASTLGKAGLRAAVYGAREHNHMKRIDRLGLGTMFTSLPPAALMLSGIFTGGAVAAEHVVPEAGSLPTGIVLADGDSLTNSGSIANNGAPAVEYPGPNTGTVAFILNNETGTIEATGGWAIGINGSLDRFENHGTISTDTDAALGVGGDLGTFINTGTMTTTDGAGVGVNGNVGSFDNSGTITGANDPAAVFNGTVGTFANSGTMQSATGWTSIFFEDGVTSFDNSGAILNTSTGRAVEVDLNNGAVGTFTNSGTITGGAGRQGVGMFGNAFGVGTFTNSGTITATGNSAVKIDGAVSTFTNSGTLISDIDNAAGFDSLVGSFTNSGTITGANWDALFFGKGVGEFVNAEGGVIQNVNHNGNGGNGIGFNTDLVDGGQVVSFENHGTITGDAAAAESAGVGFWSNGNGAFDVGSFTNTGTISGSGNGVNGNGGFGTFSNSGTITANLWQGVRAEGAVGTFTNTGTITSVQDNAIGFQDTVGTFTNSGTVTSDQARGVGFDGLVTSFSNSGTIDSYQNGVSFNDGLVSGNNSGTIISRAATNEIGVRIDGPGTTFTNTGTIEGAAAVAYVDNPGDSTLVNAGTLRGTDGGAVWFNTGNDLLRLETGSQIFGDIGFGGGDDTVDVSGFSGNTLLRVYDLENVVPGDKLVHFDQPNDLLAVIEPAGITQPAQLATTGLAGQVNNIIGPVLNTAGASAGDAVEPMGYMPVALQTAADLAIVEPPAGPRIWTTAIGGGSTDSNPVNISSLYGALVAGTHAELAGDTTVGGLVGVGRGRVDVGSGNHIVDSTTGIAGLYGRHTAGIVDLDFSLLAGVSGHQSSRQVVALGGLETARADYASWFVAPALGVAIPVLQTDTGEVDLVGRVSYVGGNVAGYTETGSSLNLTVGNQAIGLLDARLGLDGTFDVDGTNTILNANAGLFAQSKLGGTTVPVTFLGQTQNTAVAGSTEFGLYGGVGLTAHVSPSVTLTAGADAQWHFSGQVSGAIRAGLSAGF